MKTIKESNKTWKTTKKSKVVNKEEQKLLDEQVEKFKEILRKTEYATLEDINEVFKDSRYYRNRAKYIKIPKYLLTKKPEVVKYIIDSKYLNNNTKKQYQINLLTLLIAEKKRKEFKVMENSLREDFITNKNLRRKKMIVTVILYIVWLLLTIYWSISWSVCDVWLWIIVMVILAVSWGYANIKTKKVMDKLREEYCPDLKRYNGKEYNVSVNQYEKW